MMKRLLASLLTGATALSFTGYGAPASDTTAVQAVQKRPDISAREAISSGFAVGRAACCCREKKHRPFSVKKTWHSQSGVPYFLKKGWKGVTTTQETGR